MSKKKEKPEAGKDCAERRAYRIENSVYFFNPFTSMASIYELRKDGFAYVATRYDERGFKSYENLIMGQCLPREGNPMPKGKQITLNEFSAFVKKLEVLQEQANAFKPLVSFDDYVKIITETHALRLKE